MGDEVLVRDLREHREVDPSGGGGGPLAGGVHQDGPENGHVGQHRFDWAKEASLLAVMLVKDLGVPRIIAKAVTTLHGRILERIGVNRVIFPEREMAIRVAHSLVVANVLDYIELSSDFSIIEMPAHDEFEGNSLKDLQLRNSYVLTLIDIKRKNQGNGFPCFFKQFVKVFCLPDGAGKTVHHKTHDIAGGSLQG